MKLSEILYWGLDLPLFSLEWKGDSEELLFHVDEGSILLELEVETELDLLKLTAAAEKLFEEKFVKVAKEFKLEVVSQLLEEELPKVECSTRDLFRKWKQGKYFAFEAWGHLWTITLGEPEVKVNGIFPWLKGTSCEDLDEDLTFTIIRVNAFLENVEELEIIFVDDKLNLIQPPKTVDPELFSKVHVYGIMQFLGERVLIELGVSQLSKLYQEYQEFLRDLFAKSLRGYRRLHKVLGG